MQSNSKQIAMITARPNEAMNTCEFRLNIKSLPCRLSLDVYKVANIFAAKLCAKESNCHPSATGEETQIIFRIDDYTAIISYFTLHNTG